MKPINTFLALLFISLLSSPSWGETMDDLVERNGLYYQKFINVPFSGNVTGNKQGLINKGKQEGVWVSYRENGQLWAKGNLKDGKLEGAWIEYYTNGQLMVKGNFKNDEFEGPWVGYNEDGSVWKKFTGTFKDGTKISD